MFSVFGPSRWIPKVRHLCGFAMGQLVLQDSPFYSVCSLKQKIYWKFLFFYSRKFLFHRCSKLFYSENEYISDRVEQIFKNTKCYTVTNYYNPIYDTPEKQTTKPLPYFNGITLLTISTAYPYKNLQISLRVAHILKTKYPNLSFRFVFTCQKEEFLDCEYVKRGLIFKNNKKEEKIYDLDLENFVFIGKVDLKDCPSLYEQCDMVFLPSLMECFTALYPESFRMQKPLLTSDLPFARGLCGKAAEYFPALDAEKIAQTIHQLANNTSRQKELIKQGLRQLSLYDNNTQRMETVMSIMEKHFH